MRDIKGEMIALLDGYSLDTYDDVQYTAEILIAKGVIPVVRCKDCKHSKPIDTKQAPFRYYKPECLVCYCEEVVGDEPMVYYPTHFCSYGERRSHQNILCGQTEGR